MTIIDENFFADKYPANYPDYHGLSTYQSALEVLDNSIKKYPNNNAFICLGQELSYADLGRYSAQFADFIQNHTELKAGDRIAVQLPNILQYPIVVFGAMRAGLIVVNTNPLYTEREMEHQFTDSGAKALVVLANMASKAEAVLPKTDIKTVIVTQVGDMHSGLKRPIINAVVKYIQKQVPAYHIPSAISLRDALAKGASANFTTPASNIDDVAVLQYTGGTTGVAKGAMLTHGNLLANMSQASPLLLYALKDAQTTNIITPLPLYHIYAFTVHCMVMLSGGNCNVLIPNPRDLKAFVKALRQHRFAGFVGLNTLFVALANNDDFINQVDFSDLKVTISGGMALTRAGAELWQKATGCEVTEGYGMTEASPVVSFNLPGHTRIGSIGLPLPDTLCKVIDDEGNDLAVGEIGELCVKGPQVMKGYWQRDDATAKVIDANGWLKTGDVAIIAEDGYISIVDRKKDMIIVSGFNVYPNEVEDMLTTHPDIIEVAAVGVPDNVSGEIIKVFVVAKKAMTAEEVIEFARTGLTGYKVPKLVEFRDELPKTNVGKILRRELRDSE